MNPSGQLRKRAETGRLEFEGKRKAGKRVEAVSLGSSK